jgi:tRNA dimethylallyltransferase
LKSNSDQRPAGQSDAAPESFLPLVDDVIVLTGPTAAGKTAVALELAERIGGEILSLDSIAVYRDMDIGTAKPSRAEQDRVQHHLIDLVEPDQDFSVACYLRQAHRVVADLKQRGTPAIFTGGTPMFLKGVLRGFDPGPPADWEFRRAVEEDIHRHGIEALRERLRQVDPLASHRIGPNDSRRMIRALEVAKHTGRPISHQQTQFDRHRDPTRCNVFCLAWPRAALHHRIEQRVQSMFDAGLISEVKGLLDRYGRLSRTASQAVGYREVIAWLQDGGELDGLIELVENHTRQLARRQETWFRSFQEIRSLAVCEPLHPAEIVDRIIALMTI